MAKARLVVLVFVTLAVSACNKPAPSGPKQGTEPPPTVVSATVNGRTVRATIAGSASIQPEGDAVAVTTDKHRIVVERQRVTIDGVELLKLRPAVDFVEFYLSRQGYFTMNADRAGVATKQLPSAVPYKKQEMGGATRLDGRVVHYSVFGDSCISPEGETAVITTEAHKIVVERDRVTLDGAEVVQVSPTAKDIRVTLTEDRVFTVQVDGYTAHSKPLPK